MNIELCNFDDIVKKEFFFESRYEVFSRRLNWNVTVHDGKEYDQYDNSNAKYIIISENYEIIASVRLIETKHPHLLTGSFHEYFSCNNYAPIEATRFFVRKNVTTKKDHVCQILFASMIEYCLTEGHISITAIVGRGMNKLLNKYGWTPEIIEKCFIENKSVYLINLPASLEICIKIKDKASMDPCKHLIPIVKEGPKEQP